MKQFLRAIFCFYVVVSTAIAQLPVRDPLLLDSPVREVAVEVLGTRVAIMDYDLIRNDFSELRRASDAQIDQWFLTNASFISQPQSADRVVNSPIKVGVRQIQALRPHEYGRALVFDLGKQGLIDAKGAGSLTPLPLDHSNGLVTLGEALREFMFEKLVNLAFRHSASKYGTVEIYGVLDFGFDVIHPDGSRSRAGLVLRQAHQRSNVQSDLLPNDRAGKIEKLLRRYGISSAGAHREMYPYDLLNVQGTRNGREVFDFGGYFVSDKFERPVVNFFSHEYVFNRLGKVMVPASKLQVPLSLWGSTVSGIVDPKFDNPWIWSHELAESFARGDASRSDISQRIGTMFEPLEAKFGLKAIVSRPWLAEGRSICAKSLPLFLDRL